MSFLQPSAGDASCRVGPQQEGEAKTSPSSTGTSSTSAPIEQVEEGQVRRTDPTDVEVSSPLPTPQGRGDPRTVTSPAPGEGSASRWYHEADEEPPPGFYTEDWLRGSKRELSMALAHRREGWSDHALQKAVGRVNSVIWVRRISYQMWEIFFKSRRAFEIAREQLERYRRLPPADLS